MSMENVCSVESHRCERKSYDHHDGSDDVDVDKRWLRLTAADGEPQTMVGRCEICANME